MTKDSSIIKQKIIKLDDGDAIVLQCQKGSSECTTKRILWLEAFQEGNSALIDISPAKARKLAAQLLLFADLTENG